MSNVDQEVRDLKQRVAKLERQVAFLLRQQDLEYHDDVNQSVTFEVQQLVHQGRKIQAIKLYREATGASLKQAKDYVDALE